MVRVTNEMMVTATLRRLQSRLASYEDRQQEVATGRRINRPSDDPAGASKAMTLRSSIRARMQEERNANDALTILDRTDVELQNSITQIQRAKTLALRAGNTIGPTEREAIASELDQIQAVLVGVANTRNGERPLFSGFADDNPVQVRTTPPDPAPPWDAAYTGEYFVYTGDAGAIERRVTDEDQLQVNSTAEEAFGLDGSGNDIFNVLERLSASIRANDAAGVQTGLTGLDTAREQISEELSVVGARANRVQSALDRTSGTILALRSELSETEDADMQESVMGLRVEEIAYEATLQALGRALPDSLASFLR